MKAWMWILFAVIAVLILVGIEVYRELHRFQTVIYEIETEKIKKESGVLKIAFLSDLHNHVYGRDNEELLSEIKKAEPDYILIGGDMLIGKKGKHLSGNASLFIGKLSKIAPVYYANGNHEQRMHEQIERYGDSYEIYKEYLEQSGVTWLENKTVQLHWKQESIYISGMELPMDCYRRPRKRDLKTEDVEGRIGTPKKDLFQILLAHHPDYARVYRKWGADLILSGHLHGGVARLPLLGGVISPQAGLFPKYSGDCYEIDGGHIVVSKGLGTHTVNLRFFNPAELVILHIKGKK